MIFPFGSGINDLRRKNMMLTIFSMYIKNLKRLYWKHSQRKETNAWCQAVLTSFL